MSPDSSRIRILLLAPAPLTALLFLAALIPRIAHIGRFVTWDEPAWALRTVRFWQAMLDGRWAETIPSAHPGVLTVWLGGAGLAVQRWVNAEPVARVWEIAATLPGLRDTDDAALKALGAVLPAMTVPVAVFHAAGIALAFRLAARLVGLRTAVVFALLLALDPFAIALSRVLHVDAIQMTCGMVAILAGGVYARCGGRRYVVIAGVATALAALAKLPGAAVAAPVTLLIVWRGWKQGPGRRHPMPSPPPPAVLGEGAGGWGPPFGAVGLHGGWGPPRAIAADLIVLAIAAIATALALWPALWADPAATVEFVRTGSTKYASRAVDTAHFFLGQAVDEPGWRFYPVAFAFRLAPLPLLGLVLSLAAWRHARPRERRIALAAVGLAVAYVAALSLSPKKFDRYLLPTWPAWALVAALGYRAFERWWSRPGRSRRLQRIAVFAMMLALLIVQARASLDPHAIAWYAPYLGGTAGAVRAIPVGWGEGLEVVAGAIDGNAGGLADELSGTPGHTPVLATNAVPGLAPIVNAPVIPLDPENLAHADAIVRYVSDAQSPAPDWLAPILARTPVYTSTVHGVPYAWVYRNTDAIDLAATPQSDPATVLTGQPDYFSRRLRDALVLGDGPAALATILRAIGPVGNQADPDLWFITHPLAPQPSETDAAFWLDTHAHRLRRVETAHTVITRYRLAEDVPPDGKTTWIDAPTTAGLRYGEHVLLDAARWTAPPSSWTRAVNVRLTWSGMDKLDEDVTALIHVRDADGHMWGQIDAMIPRPDASVDEDDENAVAGASMPVDQDVLLYPWPGTPPGRYGVWLGVYRSADGSRLPPASAGDWPVDADRVLIGEIEIGHSPKQPSAADVGLPIAIDADLGPVGLRGAASLPDSPARQGETITVHLLWEVIDAGAGLAGDVRLSLAGEGGRSIASIPLLATPLCPTPCGWRAGERVRTQHAVRVPEGLAAGRYGLDVAVVGEGAADGGVRVGEIVVGGKE